MWHNVLPSNHGWKFEKMIKIGTAETRVVRGKLPIHPIPHTLFELRVGITMMRKSTETGLKS